ncbi:MAG: hypothetical protein GY816_07260 [Cytophagales bacterium]|nr:hypothetical protein [Cytophagales bacterium]
MNEAYRNISLIIEVRTAIKYLRIGLGEIQKITADNDFYHPAMVFLSGGLERLFKTMLCLNFEEKNRKLLSMNEIWNNRNGHDIVFLKGKIEEFIVIVNLNFALTDYDLIKSEDLINRICKSLSEYGKQGRYFNLDAVLGKEQEFDSQKEWEKIETFVLEEHFGKDKLYELLSDPKQLDPIYEISSSILVTKLETFFRAIVRQFIFGNFSSKSKQFHFEIQDFFDIEDEQLGRTDYN